VTSAGLGGLVNHVVDVEVVLALIGSPDPPTDARWPDWRDPDRPLQWLRADREHLGRLTDGSPSRRDPRSALPQLIPEDAAAEWRLVLVDQAVRRVIGGIRDWSAVVSRSRSGLRVLVSLGALRNDLLAIERSLISGDDRSSATFCAYGSRRGCLPLRSRFAAEPLLSGLRCCCHFSHSKHTAWHRRKRRAGFAGSWPTSGRGS